MADTLAVLAGHAPQWAACGDEMPGWYGWCGPVGMGAVTVDDHGRVSVHLDGLTVVEAVAVLRYVTALGAGPAPSWGTLIGDRRG